MNDLPPIIAGPIVRRVTEQNIAIWLATTRPLQGGFTLYAEAKQIVEFPLEEIATSIRVGESAWVHLLNIIPAEPLTPGFTYQYDIRFDKLGLTELFPELCYSGQDKPSFTFEPHIHSMFHGSCRNPHHASDDGLLNADALLEQQVTQGEQRTALLMLSGDQIYADDVAGPTLFAIHQTIQNLGLYDEQFQDENVPDSQALLAHPDGYYQRHKLLPYSDSQGFLSRLTGKQKTQIFTSVHSDNHLISLAEVMAMYLLVWSPVLWRRVDWEQCSYSICAHPDWQKEKQQIDKFVAGLPKVQRLMAHIPVYMIFDDHDVTDDWNLTAGWEQAAYGNPFSRRIIGNTLAAYWLCQGWGNAPDKFDQGFLAQAQACFNPEDQSGQDTFIDMLYQFEHWHYELPTIPKLVVLDIRTRRWRSETNINKPSGLMDWEALCETQQTLIGEDAVILVSPAPMFGIKSIETVQRIVTLLGQPLMVDAENWMAHPGSASTLLNMFAHKKTPRHFVILSGDVHYSFVFDIVYRFKRSSPRVWQITSSGIKNTFPQTLLTWLEKSNNLLFGPYSPLNLFTKRKRMRLRQRIPSNIGKVGLLNQSGIGYLKLHRSGAPVQISQLIAPGERVDFHRKKKKHE